MPVKVGDPIPLVLQMADDDPAVFARAVVLDDLNNPVTGSPVALTHVSGGLYRATAVLMPNTPRVHAQYRLYQDAGFTARHPSHTATLFDTFERDNLAAALDIFLGVKGDLAGYVDDQAQGLMGLVSDDGLLSGQILGDDGLRGIIEEMEMLTGTLFDNEAIRGTVIDC